jgi:SAM-dependent methyltransferase
VHQHQPQRELDIGIAKSLGTRLKPDFRLMDAHELEFPDGHFDAVIGWGILHHLDLGRALDEVARVLAPGGVMVFSEPLDMNPVARLVRRLTPKARTPDEVPFRAAELAAIRARFDVEVTYEQLLSVPVGVVSRLLLPRPDNALTRLAHAFDDGLQRRLPRTGPWYRKATFVGRPRGRLARPAA